VPIAVGSHGNLTRNKERDPIGVAGDLAPFRKGLGFGIRPSPSLGLLDAGSLSAAIVAAGAEESPGIRAVTH
jgi:hypothetical protein